MVDFVAALDACFWALWALTAGFAALMWLVRGAHIIQEFPLLEEIGMGYTVLTGYMLSLLQVFLPLLRGVEEDYWILTCQIFIDMSLAVPIILSILLYWKTGQERQVKIGLTHLTLKASLTIMMAVDMR